MTTTGKSVEEMARELADNKYCNYHKCHPSHRCYECWMESPERVIRAKYAELKGEGE